MHETVTVLDLSKTHVTNPQNNHLHPQRHESNHPQRLLILKIKRVVTWGPTKLSEWDYLSN